MAKIAIKNILTDWKGSKSACGESFLNVDRGIETPLIAREITNILDSVLVVFPVLSEVEECAEQLSSWLNLLGADRVVHLLPETVSGQRFIPENEAARARVLNQALTPLNGLVFLVSVSAFLSPVPSPDDLAASRFTLKAGETSPMSELVRKLVEMDYDDELQCGLPGEFSRRGGILDIYSPASAHPARMEFFGDVIESIRLFDPASQRTFEHVSEYGIVSKTSLFESSDRCFLDYFPDSPPALMIVSPDRCFEHVSRFENAETAERWEGIVKNEGFVKTLFLNSSDSYSDDTGILPDIARTAHLFTDPDVDDDEFDEFHSMLRCQLVVERIKQWIDTGYSILVSMPFEKSRELLREWCVDNDIEPDLFETTDESIPFGLTFPMMKKVVVTEKELFSAAPVSRVTVHAPKFDDDLLVDDKAAAALTDSAEFADLEPGDNSVHFEFGICVYKGVVTVKDEGVNTEMFELEFADEVTAYVPLSQAHLISRYIGSTKRPPALAKKGGGKWLKSKVAAARDIKEMAEGLLRLQAMRLKRRGREFRGDPLWERLFEQSFQYEETPDQRRSADAVKADMSSPRPMDRLVCGDVGYGKTEIAMRAAFRAVMDGCQVVMMVPTTILAQQHYLSFVERFAAQPVTIDMLSRFKTRSEQKKTLARLAEGKLDIVIGTHRLAQKDVAFANLGLVVIDEEQRFGVRHKERLKHFRATVDVLTMTATPIPRTLYMAMTGLRDISAITTPPNKRMAVRTFVCKEDLSLAVRAINEELERGGQVFYLHNRVKTIDAKADELRAAVPNARFAVAHGQMDEGELELVMSEFLTGKIDVLVCTTIIESGLDISNANTIIIDRADRFGLSELYQLRGRVGRWHRQAYAYLFLPPGEILTGDARKRLAAIKRYSELGSGFRLALRDLEIRGSGNLLGSKQSGHINEIGFELYCQLLRSAVAEESGKSAEFAPSAMVVLDFIVYAGKAPRGRLAATIPESYIQSERVRLGFFKRLGNAVSEDAIDALLEEMTDRFGAPPKCVLNFLDATKLKVLTSAGGYRRVAVSGGEVDLSAGSSTFKINGAKPVLSAKSAAAKLAELLALLRSLGSCEASQ